MVRHTIPALFILVFSNFIQAQIKPPSKNKYQPNKNKKKDPLWDPNINSISYNEDKTFSKDNQITPGIDETFNIEACDKAEKVSERIFLITKNLELYVKQMKKDGKDPTDLPIKAQPVRIQIMFARLKRNLQRLYLVRKRGGNGLKGVRQCKHQTTIDKIMVSAETLGKVFNKKFNLLSMEENAEKESQKQKKSKKKGKNDKKKKKSGSFEQRMADVGLRNGMQNDFINFYEDDEEYADNEWDSVPSQFFSDFVEPEKRDYEEEEVADVPGAKDYRL